MPRKPTARPKKAPGKLDGKTVALVGKIGDGDDLREDFQTRVRRAGGRLVHVARTDPDYLFVGAGRGGKPPAIVAEIRKRQPAVQVFDLPAAARFLAPSREELLAAITARKIDSDQWEELHDLLGLFATPLDLSGADFRNARLAGARLANANLTGCDFRGADLSEAELSDERPLVGARLDDARLREARVPESVGCRFRGADLRQAELEGGRHVRADFARANLAEAQANDAELIECSFREANLTETDLNCSRCVGADFIGADLTRVRAWKANLDRANFTGATLRRADLRESSLVGADLTRVDLRNAVLNGADLTGATVDGADFDGAVLTGAKLKGVDLSKAKNYRPTVPRTPGPALRAFAKLRHGSQEFETCAEVKLGHGESAVLGVTCIYKRDIFAASEYHRGEYQSFHYVDAPTVEQAMLNLAERWPNSQLRVDSIWAKGAGKVRGKKLEAMAVAAWSEAFGVSADHSS